MNLNRALALSGLDRTLVLSALNLSTIVLNLTTLSESGTSPEYTESDY